jgi:nonribosomal peptide synthetase DhbF
MLRARQRVLASLDEDHISALARIFANNRRLFTAYQPPRYDGDLLLLAAEPDRPAPAAQAAELTERWRPFVAGRIETRVIGCSHAHMMQPEAAAEIGRILNESSVSSSERTSARHRRTHPMRETVER